MDPGFRDVVTASRLRRPIALAFLCAAALAVGACGDDSDSGSGESGKASASADGDQTPVAHFDGKPITRGEFDAWAEATLANARANPEKEFIIVYDPPPYKRCLAGFDAGLTKAERYLGTHNPKTECRAGWRIGMTRKMNELITLRWLEAEARRQKIVVTDEEARTAFAKFLGTEPAKQQWGEQSFEDLVENLGEEHVLAQARLFYLPQKIAQQGKPPTPAATKKYRARTICEPGFRATMCKNGPKIPYSPQAAASQEAGK